MTVPPNVSANVFPSIAALVCEKQSNRIELDDLRSRAAPSRPEKGQKKRKTMIISIEAFRPLGKSIRSALSEPQSGRFHVHLFASNFLPFFRPVGRVFLFGNRIYGLFESFSFSSTLSFIKLTFSRRHRRLAPPRNPLKDIPVSSVLTLGGE